MNDPLHHRPAGGDRLRFNQNGSVTVEAALTLASVIAVAGLLLAGLAGAAARIAAIDAAGAAARAAAIGGTYTPAGGRTTVTEHGGSMTATAVVDSPLGAATATAVVVGEPQR